jgi:hypothetical protein
MCTLLALGVLIDYHNLKPIGITALSGIKEVYKYVETADSDAVVLEIPLWPGDSANSSLYEYFTTLDRLKRVNGYSPVVSQEYLEHVYEPLCGLNLGNIDTGQYRLFKKMGVKYLTVHDNTTIFPSAFTSWSLRPYWTARRLMNSSFVDYIKKDAHEDIYLFKIKENVSNLPNNATRMMEYYHYPVSIDATRLPRRIGRNFFDPQIQKEVMRAGVIEDPKNYLTFGPYEYFTQGKYLVCFRLKAADNSLPEPVARIEVSSPTFKGNKFVSQEILSEKDIPGTDFPEPDAYHDFYLEVPLPGQQMLEFRTWFYKKTDIWIEKIVLKDLDALKYQGHFEAEWILGNIGEVKVDPTASEGRAIFAGVNMYPSDYLCYSPYRRFLAGTYRASFRLRIDASSTKTADGSAKGIALIDAAADSDQNIIAARTIDLTDFRSDDYNWITLDFSLDRDKDLSFRKKFEKKVDLWADCIEIDRLE